MYDDFVRERITQLRLKADISEYKLSRDLGHSRGYISNITRGKSLPSMGEFFAICDYFEITPLQFFDEEIEHPELISKALVGLNKLDESDIELILNNINRLLKEK